MMGGKAAYCDVPPWCENGRIMSNPGAYVKAERRDRSEMEEFGSLVPRRDAGCPPVQVLVRSEESLNRRRSGLWVILRTRLGRDGWARGRRLVRCARELPSSWRLCEEIQRVCRASCQLRAGIRRRNPCLRRDPRPKTRASLRGAEGSPRILRVSSWHGRRRMPGSKRPKTTHGG